MSYILMAIEDPESIVGYQLRVGGYLAEVIDGLAAGTMFFQLHFLEGPWKGLKPWFYPDEDGYILYEEDINSDGFGLNWRKPVPERVDTPVDGDLLPFPGGRTFLTCKEV